MCSSGVAKLSAAANAFSDAWPTVDGKARAAVA